MPRDFGIELRRLRLQGGLSLRALAKRVAVDFSYLSKIETGTLPPPAEDTVRSIARVLRQPPDALLRLARKIPSDLSAILLGNEHVPAFLRAAKRQRLSEQDWEELTRLLAGGRDRPGSALLARFSDAVLADRLLERLAVELPAGRLAFMELCGTRGHTLVRAALGNLLNGRIRLLKGPGCTGAVTPEFLTRGSRLSRHRDIQFLACPELMMEPKIPGSVLAKLPIETVASPHQAVQRAASEPRKRFVLLAAGFETTVPSVALAAIEARRQGIRNLFLLTSLRSMIATIREVARENRGRIDGLIAPGHMSAIVGLRPFRRIARDHRLPIVVTGFDTLDILCALVMLVRQIRKGRALAENQYGRVVQEEGNPAARRLMAEVFETAEETWKGLGKVPEGIFRLRLEYRHLDAAVLLR